MGHQTSFRFTLLNFLIQPFHTYACNVFCVTSMYYIDNFNEDILCINIYVQTVKAFKKNR